MFADQIFESIDRFGFGDVELHGRFAHIEIHFARRAADVTKIRVRHFARPVNDATHDRDLHPFEMRRRRFNFRGRRLQIEQGPPARRARDVIRFENPRPGSLENVVAQSQGLSGRVFPLHHNRVPDSITQQRTDVGRSR